MGRGRKGKERRGEGRERKVGEEKESKGGGNCLQFLGGIRGPG